MMNVRICAFAAACLLVASCGGGGTRTSSTTTSDTVPPLENPPEIMDDADALLAAVQEIVGPCAMVESTFTDGRHRATCTTDIGSLITGDVWLDEPVSAPHHLYRSAQLASSVECSGDAAGVFTSWLAGANWMVASADETALNMIREQLGGTPLDVPDCTGSTCGADTPWTQIDLLHTADGFVPSAVEQRADGAELCVASDSAGEVNVMFMELPEDYDTSEFLSAPVTQRQIFRVGSVMQGISDDSPVSTWLEPGHHLVLIERSGLVVWDTAAIQLRPDVGPTPVYPTLPLTDVVPETPPLRFLLQGGAVAQGSEDDRSGEFTLTSGDSTTSFNWMTLHREPFAEWVADRLDSGTELAPAVVDGFDTVVVAYSSEDHTALLHDDTYLYEFRAPVAESEFRSLLAALVIVPDAEWRAAYAPEMVTPDELASLVAEMLDGVDLPDTLEPASFEELDVAGDRYSVGVAVVDLIVCEWLENWERSPAGSPEREAAVSALSHAATWPILIEMERSGGYTDVIRQVGTAVGEGADPQAALTFLDQCGF
jgi:hypothetical protein